MEIYLVRHSTPKIEKGICYGQADLDLAHSWPSEFDNIKRKLPIHSSVKVFSSPLKRCALLAQSLNNDVTFHDHLKELNFGHWELKSWNDIPEEELNPWMEDFVNIQIPNGESYTVLATRVMSCFETISKTISPKPLIIVTHAGPIRSILANILRLDLKDSFKIKINYGDVFHITKAKEGFKLNTAINL
ncbi:alpha-ribazole phosphatase [Seonamhaeicola marinus]|uniref:Alpha-ribazole phosphatase n=1 Tax=Seonamhaeicola marinus TaxID=1912246 RepID=A0A5D0JBH2_9FLAO|nr:alpha-ribazole phosphatase [Seonamhaeicola marinus]TYA92228.1 alpha-ribazole phosphatase [Seonamhaeicola marinus]